MSQVSSEASDAESADDDEDGTDFDDDEGTQCSLFTEVVELLCAHETA